MCVIVIVRRKADTLTSPSRKPRRHFVSCGPQPRSVVSGKRVCPVSLTDATNFIWGDHLLLSICYRTTELHLGRSLVIVLWLLLARCDCPADLMRLVLRRPVGAVRVVRDVVGVDGRRVHIDEHDTALLRSNFCGAWRALLRGSSGIVPSQRSCCNKPHIRTVTAMAGLAPPCCLLQRSGCVC